MISNFESTLGAGWLTAKVAAVDYESFYDTDDNYSLSCMSYWHYNHDPRAHAYLVSIVTNDGFEWVGDPKDAPWERIKDYVWVSHNKPSDGSTHQALQEKGIVPAWLPPYWGNSANLCAYIRSPRALAKAMSALYGEKRSKKIRDVDMDGVQWQDHPAEKQEEIRRYALQDSRDCLRIWMDHVSKWPEHERRIADLTDQRGLRGVSVDREGLEADIKILKQVLFEAEAKIPWRETEKLLSAPALAAECRRNGIEPPQSLDMKDAALAAWEDEFGEKYPFVEAMRDYRRMNSVLQKYEIIRDRIKPDGRAEFSIRYLGTHTGRTAAGEKGDYEDRRTFNMLNLPRSPFFIRSDYTVVSRKKEMKEVSTYFKKSKGKLPEGYIAFIDLRGKIIPGPGKKFGICDMSQIEARITNWLAREKATMDMIRQGYSVYEVHAVQTMGYVLKEKGAMKEDAPDDYALAKARELALGFQAGHVRFIEMAPTYISDEDCERIFSKPVNQGQVEWYLESLRRGRQTEYLKEWETLKEKDRVARVNSQMIVHDYRAKKPGLAHPKTGLWKRLDNEIRRSVGSEHQIELPSGRLLRYFDVAAGKDGLQARTEIGGPFKYFYGGKLLENTVQATARDIFVYGQLRLHEAGIDVLLDVYDENITEVDLDFPVQRIAEIMTENPPWAKSLPLGAEVKEAFKYQK